MTVDNIKRRTVLNTQPSWEKKRLHSWLQLNGSAIMEKYNEGQPYGRSQFCYERASIGKGSNIEEADTAVFCVKIISTNAEVNYFYL